MKKIMWIIPLLLLSMFFEVSPVSADESPPVGYINITLPSSPPVVFENVTSGEEILKIIENSYNPRLEKASSGTKWGEGKVEYDGKGSMLITNYFWVNGGGMHGTDKVSQAQKKAVIEKYGKVENNRNYKMKTQQKLNPSGRTQGYYTVWAKAWCYGKS